MSPTISPTLKTTALLGLLSIGLLSACSDDDDASGPASCEDSWECTDFVEASALSVMRHGHDAIAMSDGKVLMIQGSARESLDIPASSYTNSWELYDTETDEVVVAGGENELVNRRHGFPDNAYLEGQGVLRLGGIFRSNPNADGTPLTSVEFFSSSSQEWTRLDDTDFPLSNVDVLADGDVLAYDINDTSDGPTFQAQFFNTSDLEWRSGMDASVPGYETPDGFQNNGIQFFDGHAMADGTIFGLVNFEFEEMEPEDDAPPIIVYLFTALTYDPDSGEVTIIDDFGDAFGVDVNTSIDALPNSDDVIFHLQYADEFDDELNPDYLPTQLYRYSPGGSELELITERDPHPGDVGLILPGDEILYTNPDFLQTYDITNDIWRDFNQFPPNLRYSSMILLDDCRLFVSGQQTLDASLTDDVLTEYDTGYCMP